VIEDGHAVHYTAVKRGTPVYGSDEQVVARTAELAVTLTIPAAEAATLPPPESGSRASGVGKRLFGGLRRR
jgi:hypothetical protein